MALTETQPGRSGQTIVDTARIALGSLDRKFEKDTPENREVFRSGVSTEVVPSPNSEISLLDDTLGVVDRWGLKDVTLDYSRPYWNPSEKYNGLEVVNVLSQYVDFYDFSLPKTVLPPQEDVKQFMDRVLESKGKLSIPQQLDIALDITKEASGTPNIIGASGIAFIGSRLGARGLDQRAYPEIKIGPDELKAWNEHVAAFPDEDSGRYDGPGDTYYFWSHFFGATSLKAIGGIRSEAYQKILDKGTPLMRTVRTHIARRPTETPHEEASVLGRQIGLAVAETLAVGERPVFSPTNE